MTAAFDKGYIADKLQTHVETADLLAFYARDGDNPALNAWAAETLPTVKERVDHAKSLSRS